jgi:hypothetical protein
VDGVEDAKVLFPSGQASVVYDFSVTSPEEFIGELARLTAFDATVTSVVTGADEISGEHDAELDMDTEHDMDMDAEHDHDHDGEEGGHETP